MHSQHREWNDIIKLGKAFEAYISIIGQDAILDAVRTVINLDSLDTYLGYNELHIYITSTQSGSFSDPLTLNIRHDNTLSLGLLIHEIIHNFERHLGYSKTDHQMATFKETHINQLTVNALQLLNVPSTQFDNFMEALMHNRHSL